MRAPALLAPGSIPGWVLRGRCGQEDPELFFPNPADESAKRRAVEVCFECPVMLECLAYVSEHPAHGVWGGTTEEERDGHKLYRPRRGA